MRKVKSLPTNVREGLLSRVAAMRRAEDAKNHGEHLFENKLRQFTDFSTLPGYEELRLQSLVGEKLGLENPYFRTHDGRAGARTSVGGRELFNFSCYDYLGLNGHPEVVEAAKQAVDKYGISATASRHVAGERLVHRSLERALARHYASEDALVFVSGYATNVSVIAQLTGPKDLIVSDAAIHNSAVMGTVLSGATRRSFLHNNLDNLEEILSSLRAKFERVLIVVEGLYSMDGDYPDLRRLVEIKKRHHAWLMVDEAHSLGVLGATGGGLYEHFNVASNEVDVWMGTLSKTLAGCGGYIVGSGVLIDYLRCMAGAFVYSVGMPPLIAASVEKSLEIMHREPERVARLQKNGQHFQAYAKKQGLNTGTGSGFAVVPIIIGESIATVLLSQELFKRGINVQPVLYPAVPVKSSRLRFFLTAMHTKEDIETAIDITVEELAKIPAKLRSLGVTN